MSQQPSRYRGYRLPPEIIAHAVWLYHRFGVSFREVEDLLAQRGITVSYEAIRQWCRTFGPAYARTLRRRQGQLGDTWYLDEVFVTIRGRQQYLWRAVDPDGDLIDVLVQSRRNRQAAARFFRKLLKGQGREPRRLITDKLRSYSAALTAPSCRQWRTAPGNTRTIEPRCLTSQRDSASARCAGSSQPRTRSDFSQSTASSSISSVWAVTCSELSTTGCSERGRSGFGRR